MSKAKYTILISNLILGAFFFTLPFREEERGYDFLENSNSVIAFFIGISFLTFAYNSVIKDDALTRNSKLVKFLTAIAWLASAIAIFGISVHLIEAFS